MSEDGFGLMMVGIGIRTNLSGMLHITMVDGTMTNITDGSGILTMSGLRLG